MHSLRAPGSGGEAINTYLKRQQIWQQLRAEAADIGEVLVPYSLRHRYSCEGHRLGIPAKDLSQAMGHSLECHLRAYAQFTSNETAKAFSAATARMESSLSMDSEDSSLLSLTQSTTEVQPPPMSDSNTERTATDNLKARSKRKSTKAGSLNDPNQLTLEI